MVHAPDGPPPRERLRHVTEKGLRAGLTQARLDLEALADDWPEVLLDVLRVLAAPPEPALASTEQA